MITPFSNGTEFMMWHDRNCSRCSKYEHISTIRNKARCKFAFDIDFATAYDGKIPLNTAKWIGYKDGELNYDCNMKNIPFGVAKFDRNKMFELKLF